jgi:hypothetical protein
MHKKITLYSFPKQHNPNAPILAPTNRNTARLAVSGTLEITICRISTWSPTSTRTHHDQLVALASLQG